MKLYSKDLIIKIMANSANVLIFGVMITLGVYFAMNPPMFGESLKYYQKQLPALKIKPKDVQFILGMLHIMAGCIWMKYTQRGSMLITLCMILNCMLLGNPLIYDATAEVGAQIRALLYTTNFLGLASISFLK